MPDWQEAPTYRRYDNLADQWLEWKRQANTLPIIELQRHAAVSRENRHACTECFCCACVELLGEKKALARGDSVIRYVVTKLDTSGTAKRTLFDPAQGRYTYASAEQAQARADAFKSDRHCKDMALEVRPCACWPIHFDPKGRWFE